MNQVLVVLATKLCSLLFYLHPRILCESSLNGCSHQVMFESFTYRILMNQALMVVATKSCSNSFSKLSSIVIYINYYFFKSKFRNIEREGDIYTGLYLTDLFEESDLMYTKPQDKQS